MIANMKKNYILGACAFGACAISAIFGFATVSSGESQAATPPQMMSAKTSAAPIIAAPVEQIVAESMAYARGSSFEKALASLDTIDAESAVRFDVMFARARILTWSGDYTSAEPIYYDLMEVYPDNPDVRVSYGYQKLFSGDAVSAVENFEAVVQDFPDYQDAINGLERARSEIEQSETLN